MYPSWAGEKNYVQLYLDMPSMLYIFQVKQLTGIGI